MKPSFLNKIHNGDCLEVLKHIPSDQVSLVVTSPPYNTSRRNCVDRYSTRYTEYTDDMNDSEYVHFTMHLFGLLDNVLMSNGVICYNISSSAEKPFLMWDVVTQLHKHTNFGICDTICWKKPNALPNNTSHNKLTRIVEFIFVFCRKNEVDSYHCNKKVSSVQKNTKQCFYKGIQNYISTKPHQHPILNYATYPEELSDFLIQTYGRNNGTVLDPFMGTGTTAISAIKHNMDYIGTEIDAKQVKYANQRINNYIKEKQRCLF